MQKSKRQSESKSGNKTNKNFKKVNHEKYMIRITLVSSIDYFPVMARNQLTEK